MEKWFVKNKKIDYMKLSDEAGIDSMLAKVLVNRDINTKTMIDKFINGSVEDLYPASLMTGVEEGANLIKNKIKSKKIFRIVGDYDVDGIMSVYILFTSLLKLGANVDYVIPNRVSEGYGINKNIIDSAINDGVDTIITCDNGIAAVETVEYAKTKGLTIIITDHHDFPFTEKNKEKQYIYPKADIIINPKNPKCNYPFKHLCGAGVAYKLIVELYNLFHLDLHKTYELLEYVSIATVCDVVDLIDENRIIVKHGLKCINSTKNLGLKALIEEINIKNSITSYHLGFIIGPTLNASGRLDTAYAALDLLLTRDEKFAKDQAKELIKLNDERKKITDIGLKKVINQIKRDEMENHKILLVYEPSIHESVAGIIAGRIKELYNRPSIILTKGIEGVKGSGRSIEGYNMFYEISRHKDILNKFGGHPMAAGLTLDKANIETLRDLLNETTSLKDKDLIKKVFIDMAFPIDNIDYKKVKDLESLEPFGKANSKPLFGDRGLSLEKLIKLGVNKNVFKLFFSGSNGNQIEGIMFKGTESFEEEIIRKYGEKIIENLYIGQASIPLDILYYPSLNEYMGRTNIQVIIQSYRL